MTTTNTTSTQLTDAQVADLLNNYDVEESGYLDAIDYCNEEEVEDNDEYMFGGYGSHFDCYSTFDADDYEFCQGGY